MQAAADCRSRKANPWVRGTGARRRTHHDFLCVTELEEALSGEEPVTSQELVVKEPRQLSSGPTALCCGASVKIVWHRAHSPGAASSPWRIHVLASVLCYKA